jgi:hypothetical protein
LIEENKPEEVPVKELTSVVSSRSLKELRDILFFSTNPFGRPPISRYAYG